jgi:probable phosphoglycerate mutase
VHLNETGRRQAAALPDRLLGWKIDAIYASPLERAQETAQPVSERFGIRVQTEAAFAEFDFGEWSRLTIAELDALSDWKLFCQFRSSIRAPGGELITEVQTRMVSALQGLAKKHPDQIVAIFTHADAVKAALMHYLPVPSDHIYRLQIDPASITVLHLSEGPVIAGVNIVS